MTTKTGQLGQKSWGLDCWNRTARTGKPGQESQDRTAREDSLDGTGRTRQRGQDGQNMTEGQGNRQDN